ncbi:MAG: bifunctional precorrin-2 dehydrogenase/sirohydrochlorin ferrochelatase [Geobacter sp.]|nr:bifunctional precorrin-2 dehydrogenase/sirohydrochlorin ferrochelatase [Geobacter sp.]
MTICNCGGTCYSLFFTVEDQRKDGICDMPHLPIALDVQGKRVVMVGGGRVAARKCPGLIRCGAQLIVIALQLSAGLRRLEQRGWLVHHAREYRAGDLAGAFLVYAATDSPELNQAIRNEAASAGILVNVVDAPASGSFHSPAVVRRGSIAIAITTGGEAPALARRLRRQLATGFGREYALTARLLGAIREKLLTQCGNRAYNKQILSALAASDLPKLFRTGSFAEIDDLLRGQCGTGYSLTELDLRKEDSP